MDKSKIKTHIERISSIIDEHSNSEIRCAIVKTVMSYLSECDTNIIEENTSQNNDLEQKLKKILSNIIIGSTK